MLKDEKGFCYEFPPYFDIKDGEPDPLEYYAYYLGLYINDMACNRIFINYVMSFPVTYTKELKQKIIQSFTRGVTKSLPTALLNDERFKGINVQESFSEQIAYAKTALEKYHFNERVINGETCCYAVFDFGGGTTDFDFGIYSLVDEK